MTQDKKRIKIAEACGWKPPTTPEVDALQIGWTTRGQHWLCPKGVLRPAHHMPDYFNDLKSMQEAIQVLDYEQAQHFYNELWDIVVRDLEDAENPQPVRFAVTCATAEQRAEAFGLTLNLW